MKKSSLISKIFIILSLLFITPAFAKNMEHPGVLNLDLSNYTRTLDFTRIEAENIYTAVITNIKLKKDLPLAGDTVVLYFNCSSNVNIPFLSCEFISENNSIGINTVQNLSDKKAFVGNSAFILKDNLSKNISVRISIKDEDLNKKPWLQFKTAKIVKEEIENTTSYEEEEIVKEKNPKKTNSQKEEKSEVIENSEPTNKKKEIKAATENSDQKNEAKATKENKTQKNVKTKKLKKNELPDEIKEVISNNEITTSAWYICKIKSKQQAGKVFSGPFANKQQAILVWAVKNLPEGKNYCIAKNYTYVTDSPSTYFRSDYGQISNDIETLGRENALNKYFFQNPEFPETTESKTETEVSKKEEPEVTIKESEAPATPIFELPLFTEDSNLYSKYQKEYLQDYAPSKEFTLPTEKIREKTIENPNETDAFGSTLLMRAARNGNNWEIKSLIASGADVNLTDKDGWTALMYACRHQENISTIESLINAGAKVKVKNNFDLSPLILAASYNGNPEIIKKLLSYYSVSEKEVLQAFILLLSDNSSSDFAKIAKIEAFLDKSIPLNTFYNGKTPLMYAALYCNSTSILQRLMEEGAITSIRSTEGKTAFDYAQDNNKLKHDDIYWSLNKK